MFFLVASSAFHGWENLTYPNHTTNMINLRWCLEAAKHYGQHYHEQLKLKNTALLFLLCFISV